MMFFEKVFIMWILMFVVFTIGFYMGKQEQRETDKKTITKLRNQIRGFYN